MNGSTFGLWTIAHLHGKTPRGVKLWWCKCACGTERAVSSTSLLYGRSRSCGCDRDAKTVARSTKHNGARRSQFTPEYKAWRDMMKRCFQTSFKDYHLYGGRGITVCEHWRTAANFIAEIPPKPPGAFTLGRIANNGNYEPGNVRWETMHIQTRNTRRNRMISFDGCTLCLTDMAAKYGLPEHVVRKRLNRGWSVELALTGKVTT